jgi:hypothetical protein
MEWEPGEQAWLSYIKMELRYRETERARQIYERCYYYYYCSSCFYINNLTVEYIHNIKNENMKSYYNNYNIKVSY